MEEKKVVEISNSSEEEDEVRPNKSCSLQKSLTKFVNRKTMEAPKMKVGQHLVFRQSNWLNMPKK